MTAPSAPASRLRAVTALGIVVVSILAAAMAWQASRAGEEAATHEHFAEQNRLQRLELEYADEDRVILDIELFGRFEEHLSLAHAFATQAAGRSAAASLAAQDERRLAARVLPLFGAYEPESDHGRPTFDAAYSRKQTRLQDVDLLAIEPPAALLADARKQHLRSVRFTGLAALFVAALVLLTLAEISRGAVARLFVACGAAVAATALVLATLV